MTKFSTIIRDAPIGQLIRLATGSKYLPYPEEEPGFKLPWESALTEENVVKKGYTAQDLQPSDPADSTPTTGTDTPNKDDNDKPTDDREALTKQLTAHSAISKTSKLSVTRTISRISTKPYSVERFRSEQEEAIDRTTLAVIIPTHTEDGIILIDWYTTEDPENPQNWTSPRKVWACAIIAAYTFVAYAASAIYISSVPGIMLHFDVGITKAALGLSMYVIGYGIGPLIFSPLSEIPVVGRNWPYVVSFGLFTILAVPTALVDSYAALLVLRFITGYMSSPALATGGATMGDMYSILKLPYALTAWTAAIFCGSALGPLLSGYAVMKMNWRWSLWEILWMAAPVFIVMFLFMPETSASWILLHRARRLRKLTGNDEIKSQSEIDQAALSLSATVWDQLLKPMEITIKDPAVLFTNVYTSALYGIYYSFFEVFPIVYQGIYGFNLGELGLPFLVISIGCAISATIYVLYGLFYLEPDIKKHGLRDQEMRLVPALVASMLMPAALFWFGWTADKDIHWIVPTIGLTLYPIGGFILMQCIFIYLPLSYPQYAASLFAANDLFRSASAARAILFAQPLFTNLGVGRGVSVLGGLMVGGVFGVWALWYFGASLRARSKFAQS